jgi:DNA-binding MarR family transcriptional regulator
MAGTKSELCLDILSAVHAISSARKRKARAEHGDSVNLVATLQAVRAYGPVRVSALADHLMTEMSTISRRLSALEAKGLVDRIADPTDRRAQLTKLAPAGTELLGQMRSASGTALAASLHSWSAADLRTLLEMLRRLDSDLSQSDARSGQLALAGVAK